MHKKERHLQQVLSHLCRYLPPLLPDDIRARLLCPPFSDISSSDSRLEERVISIGKKLWPYREAFHEFVALYARELGERMFVARLSPTARQAYAVYLAHGGRFQLLFITGIQPASLFSSDIRAAFHETLMEIRETVYRFAAQAVLTTERRAYEGRIERFHVLLRAMEQFFASLRKIALQTKKDSPALAREISEQVRAFEQGLALLGPTTHYTAVARAFHEFSAQKNKKLSER